MDELKRKIREIPDFPKPGILFYDVTTLLKDPQGLRQVIEILTAKYIGKGIQKVVGIEARVSSSDPRSLTTSAPGLSPSESRESSLGQRFGPATPSSTARIAWKFTRTRLGAGEKVLVVDDLMATGGTACATANLVSQMGGELVGLAFLVELEFLHGRQHLAACDIFSILKY